MAIDPRLKELEEARETVNAVIRRALANKSFREVLQANPRAVLLGAGLSEGAAEDFGRDMIVDGVTPDVFCLITCLHTCSNTFTHF
jgi:hypothetical protein